MCWRHPPGGRRNTTVSQSWGRSGSCGPASAAGPAGQHRPALKPAPRRRSHLAGGVRQPPRGEVRAEHAGKRRGSGPGTFCHQASGPARPRPARPARPPAAASVSQAGAQRLRMAEAGMVLAFSCCSPFALTAAGAPHRLSGHHGSIASDVGSHPPTHRPPASNPWCLPQRGAEVIAWVIWPARVYENHVMKDLSGCLLS